MAFRVKHISTRYFLQSVFTILVLTVLLILFFVSNKKKGETNEAIQKSSSLKASLELAHSDFENILKLQSGDKKFSSVTSSQILSSHNEVINRVENNIHYLKNIKYLNILPYNTDRLDSLLKMVKNYNLSFEKMVLSLRELGNENEGLISQAFQIKPQLYEALVNAPDMGLQAEFLEEYFNDYASDLSLINLLKLLNFSDKITSNFYLYDDFDVTQIDYQSSNLSQILRQIKQIEIRIFDPGSEAGQKEDAMQEYNKSIQFIDKYHADLLKYSSRYRSWWNMLFVITFAVIAIIYLILLSQFAVAVKRNLGKTYKNALILSNGDIITNKTDTKYEFEAINEELNKVSENTKNKSEFLDNILDNNFDIKLNLASKDDAVGEKLLALKKRLLTTRQEQDKITHENEARTYINEGLAKFADIMRVNNNDIKSLADTFIKNLVKYINALQGGLFLCEKDEDTVIQLIAAFAYDRKKYLNKSIRFGEGLIGTCALEKKTINLTEVPDDYVLIKSGLGDSPPKNILIVPVMYENELVGAIELASLNIFNEAEIDLAEHIASNLASTIITSRNNTQTAQLLAKSQEQAAEMAEQEEEMRQNMEELKATQEESARREDEMQGILNAIGTSFYVIEYDTSGSISHINDKLVKFVNQPYEALVNRTHQEIFSTESKITVKLLGNIKSTKISENIVEELNWGSNRYIYTHSLSPVFSSYGDVLKIINLLTIEEVEQTID